MKKILVVLLVLAVAGGVFAQEGTWSLSGGVRLSPTVNLDSKDGTADKNSAATIFGGRYLDGLGDNGDEPRGFLDAAYKRDNLTATLSFLINPGTYASGWESRDVAFNAYNNLGSLTAKLDYKTDRYELYAEAPFRLTFDNSRYLNGDIQIGRLWGYYKLLNGMVHMEVGYKGRGNGWWKSDTTAYKADFWSNTENKGGTGTIEPDTKRGTFLTNVTINNLEFGILVPNILGSFANTKDTTDGKVISNTLSLNDANNDGKKDYVYSSFVDGALMRSVFGLKFKLDPVELAAQFLFEDAGVYLGAKYFVNDVITVGFSFQGVMAPPTNYQVPILAGLNLDYKQEAFGASVNVLYGVNGTVAVAGADARKAYGDATHGVKGASSILNYADATDPKLNADKFTNLADIPQTAFGIEPTFYYNALPDYLRFRVEAGFYFRGTDIAWKLIPQITWNFLGTGAKSMGDINTGIGAKYALRNEYGQRNLFAVYFKWGF